MRNLVIIFLWVSSWSAAFAGHDISTQYFSFLSELEFDKARETAQQEKNSLVRLEMLRLADILFYEGQIHIDSFKTSTRFDQENTILAVISTLSEGYLNLFYKRVKGNAYRNFYKAFKIAKDSGNKDLIKACLFAILRYYNSEIGQNIEYHLPYLKELEKFQTNSIDSFWITIHKMIFFTQSFKKKADDEYNKLLPIVNKFEHTLNGKSPLLAYLFYEKAILLDNTDSSSSALIYYRKAIKQAGNYPFLRYHRFNGALRLVLIEINNGKFDSAKVYLNDASKEIDISDSLRSRYSLNSHASLLMAAKHKYDSAFNLLLKATRDGLELSFETNTLEISRLNVELETQEKENANLQLKQNRTWLLSALAGVGSLLVISYFAYANQRSKNKIQEKEKEVQAMKLEKVLKDQEIFGIDAMLEGQEKERQRIAADLHDNLGSLLATLKLHFNSIKVNQDSPVTEQDRLLQKSNELLEEAYQKVRGMAHAGNAGVNAQEGLVPAVKNFASKVSILNRLVIEVEEHGMNRRLENALEITIFRIIQELITNIIKHAHADSVVIHLTQHEDTINLMVEDNGIGFDISQIKPSGGMGLYSIQKKIENLGGQVTIDSIAQKGTTVIIDIPIA